MSSKHYARKCLNDGKYILHLYRLVQTDRVRLFVSHQDYKHPIIKRLGISHLIVDILVLFVL